MKKQWLLSSVIGVTGALLISLPAEAARLQFWRFNAQQNQLIFTTDETVQPQAQLLQNPARLVIDLPGVRVDRARASQSVGGGVQEIQVSQVDRDTAQIVVLLTPGYTLNPDAIQFRNTSTNSWVVQLPSPQPTSEARESDRPGSIAPSSGAATQIDSIRATSSGFFLRTSGATPELRTERDRRRNQLIVDLPNTGVSPSVAEQVLDSDRSGGARLQVTQLEAEPPTARLILAFPEGANWSASVSPIGGIVLVPTGQLDVSQRDRPGAASRPTGATSGIATIQSVSLNAGESQLVIAADRPISFTTGWDRTPALRITIPSARLAEQFQGPELSSNSPLQQVRLRQESDQSVVILVQPAPGARVGEVSQVSRQMLVLPLQSLSARDGYYGGRPNWQLPDLPRPRNGRLRIVIDPGHGGRDPGAVGLGGLREKDVVLPIALQVARLLQQRGVQVVMTRTEDRTLELEDRVRVASQSQGDLFVSIHANAINLNRTDVNGIETYYYTPSGERLARNLHFNMVRGTGMQDRGVRRARFYVLRNTPMPAVLLEVGFVTGARDARWLADPEFRSRMAVAIALGILQYVEQN